MNTGRRPTIVRRSRAERRLTFALKLLALLVLAGISLSAVGDFMVRLRGFALVAVGVIAFTYLVFPAVRWFNRRLSLGWSILAVYAAIAAVLAFGLWVIVPAVASDVQSLVAAMPSIARNAQAFINDPHNPVLASMPSALRSYFAGLGPQLVGFAKNYAGTAASNVLALLFSTVSLLATVIVIPVASMYLMYEAPGMERALIGVVPPWARPKALAVLHDLDSVLGGFIRGQLLVGFIIGVAIAIVLLILHVRYALLIGVVAGLFDLIPYVGAVVAFIPAVFIALFHDGWQHAAIVAAAFVAIYQLEGHFISPRIVSSTVGLTPLAVIVAVFIGAELAGIVGMFVSVPIAAALRILLIHFVPHYPLDRVPQSATPESVALAERPPGRATSRRPSAKSST